MVVVGGKWTENHRQGKSLNNQMSEEGFSVQVKRHWVTLHKMSDTCFPEGD